MKGQKAPFGVGELVVCYNADQTDGRLVKGWKYQITDIVYTPYVNDNTCLIPHDNWAVRVFGTETPPTKSGKPGWWKATRFRLYEAQLTDKKTEKVKELQR